MKNKLYLLSVLFLGIFSANAQLVPSTNANYLKIDKSPRTPVSPIKADSLLLWGTDKYVYHIPVSELKNQITPNLQEVTDRGSLTTNSMAVIGTNKIIGVNTDLTGVKSIQMGTFGTVPRLQVRNGLVDYNFTAEDIKTIVDRKASDQSGYEVVSVNGNLADSDGNVEISAGGSQDLQQTLDNGSIATISEFFKITNSEDIHLQSGGNQFQVNNESSAYGLDYVGKDFNLNSNGNGLITTNESTGNEGIVLNGQTKKIIARSNFGININSQGGSIDVKEGSVILNGPNEIKIASALITDNTVTKGLSVDSTGKVVEHDLTSGSNDIPLTGTTEGNPVTGDIDSQASVKANSFKVNSFGDYPVIDIFDDGGVGIINLSDTETGDLVLSLNSQELTAISQTLGSKTLNFGNLNKEFIVSSTISDSKGIVGNRLFDIQDDDLAYVQLGKAKELISVLDSNVLHKTGNETKTGNFTLMGNFMTDGPVVNFANTSNNVGIAYNLTGFFPNLQAVNAAGSATTDLTIQNSGGRVGIGVNVPTERLDVAGNGQFTGTVSGANATASNQFPTLGQVQTAYQVSSASTLSLTSSNPTNVTTFTGTTAIYTLPTIANGAGKRIVIINAGTGSIILNSNAGANDIWEGGTDTNTTNVMSTLALTIFCDGVKWRIID